MIELMKTILGLFALCQACNVFAQGTVLLTGQNSGFGVSFRVFGPEVGNPAIIKTGNRSSDLPAGTQVYTGVLLSGSNFRAELWGAPGINQLESALQAGSPGSSFRTGTAAGVVASTTVSFNNIPKDYLGGGTFQLRVWDNSSGFYPTWNAAQMAWFAGVILAAKGPLLNFDSTIGGDINPAPFLPGMQSFGLPNIPEPSTLSLAGFVALALFRRRRRHA